MNPRTLYDKIWEDHLVDEQPDGTCLLYVDRHLVHEVTSPQDRKSTRLNSSHLGISYAVSFLIHPSPSSTLFPYTTLFRSPLIASAWDARKPLSILSEQS